MEIYFRVHFLWLPALIWALCCIWSCAQSIHLMRSGRPHRLQRFCVFFVVENVSEMSNLGNNFQLCCMRLVLAGSHDMVAWTLLMTGQCDSWFNIETIHRVKLFYIYHLGRISLCNSFIFYRKLIKVGLNTSLLLLSYFFCSNQYFSNSTTPKWSTVRCDFVLSKKVNIPLYTKTLYHEMHFACTDKVSCPFYKPWTNWMLSGHPYFQWANISWDFTFQRPFFPRWLASSLHLKLSIVKPLIHDFDK